MSPHSLPQLAPKPLDSGTASTSSATGRRFRLASTSSATGKGVGIKVKALLTSVFFLFLFFSCKKDPIPTINVQTVFTSQANLVNCVCFPSNNVGYAGGSGNMILKSTNGGDTWAQINAPSGNSTSNSIYFADENTGFIQTDHGYFFTIDGGSLWTVKDSSVIRFLFSKYKKVHPGNGEFFIDSLNGWQSGFSDIRYFGFISRTTNGGKSWDRINTNQHNRVSDVAFANFSTGYAVGDNTILWSTDAGVSWEALRMQDGVSPPNYLELAVRDNNTCFAVHDGSIDKIYRK